MAKLKEKRKTGPRLTPPGTKPKESKKKKKMAAKRVKSLKAIGEGSGRPDSVPKPKAFGRKRTASATSSPASSETPAKARKSISFAAKLVQAKAIPDIDVSLLESSSLASPDVTPSRSILKPQQTRQPSALAAKPVTKPPAKATAKAKGETKGEAKEGAKGEAEADEPPADLDASLPHFADGLADKKKKSLRGMMVKKEDKEQLKTMNRKEKKEFIRTLKAKRKVYFDVAVEAKTIWEKLRSRKTPEVAKEELVTELRALVKGKVRQLMMAHDTVRVIQCLVSLKRQDVLDELFEELTASKDALLLAAKSQYAHHLLLKIVKNGTKPQRATLLQAFKGRIPVLFRNNYAAEVLELIFNDFAVAAQRRAILLEFYGPEYRLFQDEMDAAKTSSVVALVAGSPKKAAAMVKELKEHLLALSSKPQLRHSLCHKLLADFFLLAEAESRDEVIDAIKERVVEVVHTRDGAQAALNVVWFSSAKDRKLLLRSVKNLVVKTAKEEHGHLFLLALLDTVDDTVNLAKILIKELTQQLDSLVQDPNNSNWGRKVLQYLLHPRQAAMFPKEIQDRLAQGDANPFSKKEAAVRYKELLSALAGPLLTYLGANMGDLVWEPGTALLVANALQYTLPSAGLSPEAQTAAKAGRERCFAALAELAQRDFVPGDVENQLHLVEHKNGNFLLGLVLKADAELVGGGLGGEETLAGTLAKTLSADQLASFVACNKGGFVLLRMFESGEPSARKAVAEAVGREAKRLAAYSFPSARLLLKVVRDGAASDGPKPIPASHRPSFKTKNADKPQ